MCSICVSQHRAMRVLPYLVVFKQLAPVAVANKLQVSNLEKLKENPTAQIKQKAGVL